MLYENADPFVLYEPGGYLDVTGARYTALDPRRVRVEGSAWVPTDAYTVKLEGARQAGFQTVSLVMVRDPHYVAHVEDWVEALEAAFLEQATEQGMSGLKGHRSVGGLRASIYNAAPYEWADRLAQFMTDFEAKNG